MPRDALSLLHEFIDPDTLLGALFYAVAFIAAAWVAGRAVRLVVRRALDGHVPGADPTTVRFLGELARLAIYVFALLSYVYEIPVLRQLGSVWLTSVGVASIVVGIAAQNTLGNLISGVSILLYRPFRLGDRLQVMTPAGLESGIVESLSLGYTTLRTDDNRRIVIPNSLMASQTSINISNTPRLTTVLLTLTLAPTADLDKARAILTALATSHAKPAEFASYRITSLTDTGTTITLTLTCPDASTAADIKSALLQAAKSRLDAEGIPLAH